MRLSSGQDSRPCSGRWPGSWAARAAAALAAAFVTAFSGPARAQPHDFPNRPIRLLVAFAAGGNTDLVARIVAEKAKAFLGQAVIVENKPGANGAIAADLVAKADPDGYTLFYSTAGAVAINPSVRSDLPYDPAKDFAPVGLVARNTVIVAVNPATGVRSARDLAAAAAAKPGAFTMGITGVGAISHLAIELFQTQAAIKLLNVPYRGSANALTDLIGGQVNGISAEVPVALPHLRSGKIVLVGAAAQARSEAIPDVPTFAEQGYGDVVADNWGGVLAPARTPRGVVDRLNAAFVQAVGDPDAKRRLVENGVTPLTSTPDEFATFIAAETKRWAKVVRDNGIKGEQ